MSESIDNPNAQGPFGNTLLHWAVMGGDIEEVRRLLAAGADPRIANRHGQSSLEAAVVLGLLEIHKLLAG
jgi:ankyrin repeat protein